MSKLSSVPRSNYIWFNVWFLSLQEALLDTISAELIDWLNLYEGQIVQYLLELKTNFMRARETVPAVAAAVTCSRSSVTG